MSKDQFRNSLRAAARGLWSGALSAYGFPDAFGAALDKYLRQAFDDGMARYGVEPADYTDDDIEAFQKFLTGQYEHLEGLTDYIVTQHKQFGGKLETVLARVEMWANRYDEAGDIARTRAGADENIEWKLGRAEHCETCAALSGWVKRGSYWQKLRDTEQIYPKSPRLRCNGYNCKCVLQPTRKPLSKGRPPIVV